MNKFSCTELLRYSLSVKHSERVGIAFSVTSSAFLGVYVLMTLVTVLWRTPLLGKKQTKVLIGSRRRMIVSIFATTLPVMDVSIVYAWRFLPGDAGCPPPADFFLLWLSANILNVITMGVAWFYVPYSQVMIYLPQVLYTLLASFYILMSIARSELCGTTFAVIVPYILGLVCVYFVPIGMRISKDSLDLRVKALEEAESNLRSIQDWDKKNYSLSIELDSFVERGKGEKRKKLVIKKRNPFSETPDDKGFKYTIEDVDSEDGIDVESIPKRTVSYINWSDDDNDNEGSTA